MEERCVFCDERENPELIKCVVPNWPYPNRIIYQNDFLMVVPGLGPVVPNTPYLLIIPKSCENSFGLIGPEERSAVFDFLDRLIKFESLFPFGKALIFEHGGGSSAAGCSCINHCHLHVMNIAGPWAVLPSLVSKRYPEAKDVVITAGSLEERSYLFAGHYGLRERSLVGVRHFVSDREPQILRYLVGQLTGQPWNYKLGLNVETMIYTYVQTRSNLIN